ncbi:hypothetical protein Taro_039005 [Colocasia esculenta]|uniref:Thaumatin-like protein 1 n=1 Tax=Colocasia esculenta TaxID=4460 RepID=A0A843W542_COLES|nr:hypothetical protein [Colocasia esculenta]
MNHLFISSPPTTMAGTRAFLLFFLLLLSADPFSDRGGVVHCTIFTFVNRCDYTVWPGVLSNSGSPPLGTTGFELPPGSSLPFQAPTGWSGRFWGRTHCSFDASGRGSCATGECGSGQVACEGAGAAPPATLAEFTLAGASGMDFYDVSLVDGYNLPVVVEAIGGAGGCSPTGCAVDLEARCPAELRSGDSEGCRSACEAFGSPEYCCSGNFANPSTCQPSVYSEMFKSACPRAYSYAYDDATSTFTCSGADYFITFCPSSSDSQKSIQDPAASTATITQPRTMGAGDVMLQNDAWLASLATGSAAPAWDGALIDLSAAVLVVGAAACVLILSSFTLAI